MNAQSFSRVLRTPYLLKDYSFDELYRLSQQYPYSSAINALIALKAHQQDEGSYEHYLSQAAIRVPDRRRLYHLIHAEQEEVKEEFIEPEVIHLIENVAATTAPSLDEPPSAEKDEPIPADNLAVVSVPEESEKSVVEQRESMTSEQPGEEKEFELPGVEEVADALKSIGEHKESFTEVMPPEKPEAAVEPPEDDSKHSFAEWLSLLKQNKPVESFSREIGEGESSEPFKFSKSAISEKEEADLAIKAQESLSDDLEWVTETLAKIYELQKKYDKAEEAYRMLSLKYPDKMAYFAQRIDNLRKFKS